MCNYGSLSECTITYTAQTGIERDRYYREQLIIHNMSEREQLKEVSRISWSISVVSIINLVTKAGNKSFLKEKNSMLNLFKQHRRGGQMLKLEPKQTGLTLFEN